MSEYFRGNASGRNPLEYLREREPIRSEYRDRETRIQVMDEQGARQGLALPDPRHDLRAAPQARPRGRRDHVPRVQPLVGGGLGLRLRGPHLRVAVHLARRPRRRGRGARARAARLGARTVVHATRRADHDLRSAHARRSLLRPVLGAGQRGGHHRRRARGRQRLLAQRVRQGGLLRRVLRRGPSEHRHDVDRARDLRLPRVADLRPAVRPLPEPARRLGRERRRVPARPLPEVQVDQPQDPGPLQGGPGGDLPAPHLDQPVLGGRRLRDRRPHGRRPGGVRLRLAAHRGAARTRATTPWRSKSSTPRRSG